MGTNCVTLIADLFLFWYERDFMLSLLADNQSAVIEAFSSTSRYLDDLLKTDNNFFNSMVKYGQRVRFRGLSFRFAFNCI